MNSIDFQAFFLLTVAILWLFLLVTTLYRTNRSLLRKKGISDEYVDFLRKDTIKRSIGIAIVVPALLLVSGLLVYVITGDLESPGQIVYVALLFIVLVIPFPVMSTIKLNKEYRSLALETKSEIVVDFNYRVLHLVFNPTVEAIAALLYVAFFLAYVGPFHVAFLHILILWFLYSAARSSKYLTRPLLKDGYLYLVIFLALNQLILLFHLLNESIHLLTCEECYNRTAFFLGAVLSVLLAAKFVYYASKFPKFRTSLST